MSRDEIRPQHVKLKRRFSARSLNSVWIEAMPHFSVNYGDLAPVGRECNEKITCASLYWNSIIFPSISHCPTEMHHFPMERHSGNYHIADEKWDRKYSLWCWRWNWYRRKMKSYRVQRFCIQINTHKRMNYIFFFLNEKFWAKNSLATFGLCTLITFSSLPIQWLPSSHFCRGYWIRRFESWQPASFCIYLYYSHYVLKSLSVVRLCVCVSLCVGARWASAKW